MTEVIEALGIPMPDGTTLAARSWQVDAIASMQAPPDVWRVTARLEATDAEGTVLSRDWNGDIPRDHL